MPRIADDTELVKIPASNFGYSRVKQQKLVNSQYTIFSVAVDLSGSVETFANELEKCVKACIKSCQKSPQADNLLARTVLFGSNVQELHGFTLLSDLNESTYDNLYTSAYKNKIGVMTALYDACDNAVAATINYGQDLTKQDYSVNGVFVCITDGINNNSSLTANSVKQRLEEAKSQEKLDSMLSILVAVNVQDPLAKAELDKFHTEMIDKETKRFREVLLKHLIALNKDLGGFVQTTHSLIQSYEPLEGVCEMMQCAWQRAGDYSISNLSQYIELLVKENSNTNGVSNVSS